MGPENIMGPVLWDTV